MLRSFFISWQIEGNERENDVMGLRPFQKKNSLKNRFNNGQLKKLCWRNATVNWWDFHCCLSFFCWLCVAGRYFWGRTANVINATTRRFSLVTTSVNFSCSFLNGSGSTTLISHSLLNTSHFSIPILKRLHKNLWFVW